MASSVNGIWNLPDRKPDDGACIVSTDGLVGEYEYDSGRECIHCPNNHLEFMRNWKAYAYIDDLVAASKALHEAHAWLLSIRDTANNVEPDCIGMNTILSSCDKALSNINDIMFFGKAEKTKISIIQLLPLLKPGFVAMNKNGVWCWYKLKPTLYDDHWATVSGMSITALKLSAIFDIEPFDYYWKDSCIEIVGDES